MQFIIQMDDHFTLLGLFSLNISCGLSIANGSHYLQSNITVYKFNALRMNGLPSNLVICCKTIYFNSLNKLYHLILYIFQKNIFLIRAFV